MTFVSEHVLEENSEKEMSMTVKDDQPVWIIDTFVHAILPERFGFKKTTGSSPDFIDSDALILLRLYLYGYFYQINSSKNLQEVCKTSAKAHWLMRGTVPDVKEIVSYRKSKPKVLQKVLSEFICFAKGKATPKYYSSKELLQMSDLGRDTLKSQILELNKSPEEYLQTLQEKDSQGFQKSKAGRRKKSLGLEGKTADELRELAMEGYYVRDALRDHVYCPRGITLRRKSVKKDGTIRYSNKLECRRCLKREKCTVADFKIVEFREGQEYSLCKKWNETKEVLR